MGTVRYTVANGQILAEKRAGKYRFYRSDVLGSTVSLYDSSQTKTDSFTYWPYGESRTSAGGNATKYKFLGTLGFRTQANGDIYVDLHPYRPVDGRWLVDALLSASGTPPLYSVSIVGGSRSPQLSGQTLSMSEFIKRCSKPVDCQCTGMGCKNKGYFGWIWNCCNSAFIDVIWVCCQRKCVLCWCEPDPRPGCYCDKLLVADADAGRAKRNETCNNTLGRCGFWV